MSTAFGQNESKRFALYVNLNPNDCLTCIGSLQMILKSTSGKLPIVLVVPEAYSRQEIHNLASVILGDTSWIRHIQSDDPLYQKLNAGGPSALHLLNPNNEKIRSFSTLNPAQTAAEINEMSGFQNKSLVKTYDVSSIFPAIGAGQITHRGSATAVLNQAINRFLYL